MRSYCLPRPGSTAPEAGMVRPELQPGAAGPGSASGLAPCPRRSRDAGLRRSTLVPAAPVAGGAAYSAAATRPEADGQRVACALISMTDVASAAVSSRNAAGRPKISPDGAACQVSLIRPVPRHLPRLPARWKRCDRGLRHRVPRPGRDPVIVGARTACRRVDEVNVIDLITHPVPDEAFR